MLKEILRLAQNDSLCRLMSQIFEQPSNCVTPIIGESH